MMGPDDELVGPLQYRAVGTDGEALTHDVAPIYSGLLPDADQAAAQRGCEMRTIPLEIGRCKPFGRQESVIFDLAVGMMVRANGSREAA